MHLHPKKSCEARSEIGNHRPPQADASNLSQPDSLAPRCDLLGSTHPAANRGEAAGQPFQIGEAPGRRLRIVRPIPDAMLQRILDEDAALNAPNADDGPTWAVIGLWCVGFAAIVIFLFWLNSNPQELIR